MSKQLLALTLLAVLCLTGGTAWAGVAAGLSGIEQTVIYVEPVDAPRGP
jgi:hypothetical protein